MPAAMCECCEKRSAQVTFQVVSSGKKTVRNYCVQCASKLRRGDALGVQMAVANSLPSEICDAAQQCSKCGHTLEMLQKTGRVGCAACYRAFGKATDDIIMKLNGSGRQPAENIMEAPVLTERQVRLRSLRDELAQAVSVENYERAAVLRDEINALSLIVQQEARE